MATSDATIDFLDEVKNTVSGVTGRVDAIWTEGDVTYVDVISDERMYYKSPVTNWGLIAKSDE
jgi:hypothetical protein